MKSIVITGATRGIGFGIASALLDRGCAVTICSRSADGVTRAVEALGGADPQRKERVAGAPCDVGKIDQVEALWETAVSRFGRVDIWINNAALSTQSKPVADLEAKELEGPVLTNVLGTVNGCRTAIRGMNAQGGGFIYSFEGFGSKGERRTGLTVYGMTKRAIDYLTQCLIEETQGTPVKIGSIQPGMAPTGIFMDGLSEERRASAMKIMNILGDKVETVAPWIADQVLNNRKQGAALRWLHPGKVFFRFLTAPFRPRKVVDE